MQLTLIALGTALLLTGPQPGSAGRPSADTCVMKGALVKPVRNGDVDVPAKQAGVLKELAVREGALVTEGQLLGKIDDEVEQKQKDAAVAKLKVARLQAANTVKVDYADATAKVALSEVDRARQANERYPGSVPTSEVTRLNLAYHQALLQKKQSENDLEIDRVSVDVRMAEYALADVQIDQRKVVSPIDGKVVDCLVDQEEWVQPGTTILRIIRMNRLRVQGYADENLRGRVRVGQKVTVAVPDGRPLEGEVVFVSPETVRGPKFAVWAEVDNVWIPYSAQPGEGDWLLHPGSEVDVTIDLASQPARQTAQSERS
jgi:multidrug efflux pump subunit AcrA (membrane-fusion protein)